MRRLITPRDKRRLTRLQHKLWVDGNQFGLHGLPLQLYKRVKRINLPRWFSVLQWSPFHGKVAP